MNFNEKIEIRKIAEQLEGVPTNLLTCYLLIDLSLAPN